MSSLRFFADHCVPTSIVRFLQECGHKVFVLRECIPKDSPDPVVIQTAQDYQAILVSLNGDFADIVTYPPEQFRGIIGIQHSEIRMLNFEWRLRFARLLKNDSFP